MTWTVRCLLDRWLVCITLLAAGTACRTPQATQRAESAAAAPAAAPSGSAGPVDLDARVSAFLDSRRGTWRDLNVPFEDGKVLRDLVVDGAAAWLGTSNWERDYFTHSRNVGVVVTDTAERLALLAGALDDVRAAGAIAELTTVEGDEFAVEVTLAEPQPEPAA